MVGRILTCSLRFPPPDVDTQYNPLPLSVGGAVNMTLFTFVVRLCCMGKGDRIFQMYNKSPVYE